jgi:hypothetical protein
VGWDAQARTLRAMQRTVSSWPLPSLIIVLPGSSASPSGVTGRTCASTYQMCGASLTQTQAQTQTRTFDGHDVWAGRDEVLASDIAALGVGAAHAQRQLDRTPLAKARQARAVLVAPHASSPTLSTAPTRPRPPRRRTDQAVLVLVHTLTPQRDQAQPVPNKLVVQGRRVLHNRDEVNR